jgi:tellurite resistance protein TerA
MPIDYTKRPAANEPVSLSKVSLTKASPSVSLTKQTGHLKVNLNWDAHPGSAPKPSGFLKRLTAEKADRGIDLDLGCLWELADGRKGVVQALGNAFGSLEQAPFIQLSGDDRSGNNAEGENLFVNLSHAADIRRILVFATIYEGVASFDQANGVVTLSPASGPQIEVRLDEAAGGSRMCAIALIEGNGPDLNVRREVRYINGTQRALDEAYGWGMRWTAGRK